MHIILPGEEWPAFAIDKRRGSPSHVGCAVAFYNSAVARVRSDSDPGRTLR